MLNYQRVTVCELENGPVEIMDLPSYKMLDLSNSFFGKRLYTSDLWFMIL